MPLTKYYFDEHLYILSEASLDLYLEDRPLLTFFNREDLRKTKLKNNEKIEIKEVGGITREAWIEESGELHGESLKFNAGRVTSSCFYKKGLLHGPSFYYAEEGQLLTSSYFFEGLKQGESLYYYPSGSLYHRESYLQGKYHGMQLYYYETRGIKAMMTYKSGILDGPTVLFYPEGKIKRTITFIEGKKHGLEKMYYANGTLADEGEFVFDEAIGIHRQWNKKGVCTKETNYCELSSSKVEPLRSLMGAQSKQGDEVLKASSLKDLSS